MHNYTDNFYIFIVQAVLLNDLSMQLSIIYTDRHEKRKKVNSKVQYKKIWFSF